MLFEEFLQRRSPDLRTTCPFYLGIIPKPTTEVWFSRQRMGEHKIGNIMKSMADNSGLSAATGKKITITQVENPVNRSWKKAGVRRDKIVNVTGHRKIQVLNSYEDDDEKQSRELSNFLSGVNPQHGKLPLQPAKINQSQQHVAFRIPSWTP